MSLKKSTSVGGAANTVKLAISWLWVGIPLAWGVSQTFMKAMLLFK